MAWPRFEFRHHDDVQRRGRDRDDVMRFHEVGRFGDNFLPITDDGVVVRMLLCQFFRTAADDLFLVGQGFLVGLGKYFL